jgi:type IV pilus assembly protein PilA
LWLVLALVAAGILVVAVAIFVLIAVPTSRKMRQAANETSAIQSIRTINLAEDQYETTNPGQGYACTLQALGGDPNSGPPSATSAQILQQDLASGTKAGYQFKIANCTKMSRNGSDIVTGYTIMAQPLTVGRTGDRTFCSDQSGEIKFDPTGGTNCTLSLSQ